MVKPIFSGSLIIDVTNHGLLFHNDTNEKQFIDFEICFQNYVESTLDPNRLENMRSANRMTEQHLEAYSERVRQSKYVGDRNILSPPWADGPYIEFYSLQPIRFKFETEEQFQEVCYSIEQYGWHTRDLS